MCKKKLSLFVFYQPLLLISDQAAKQQELARQAAEAMNTMCHQTQGYRWHGPITHGVLWLTVALCDSKQSRKRQHRQQRQPRKKEKEKRQTQGETARQCTVDTPVMCQAQRWRVDSKKQQAINKVCQCHIYIRLAFR